MSLFEVFYQPGKLFQSLPDRKVPWLLPMVVSALMALAITVLSIHLIGMETIVRQRLEAAHVSPEQVQAAVARANTPVQLYISYVAGCLAGPFTLLVVSGALFAFALMTSRPPAFGAMLAMVSLAYFPYWLITDVMVALVLLATPDRTTLNINNLLATNIGAYMDPGRMARGLYTVLSSIDVLSFVLIGLLAYGFSKLTKAGMFFGLLAVGGLWVFYVAIRMALSLIF